MLVPHAFATHLARTVELFRDPQAKTGQKAQFRALLALLKHDAVTVKSEGGRLSVNGTAVEGVVLEPLRQHLERHAVGELSIPASPPPDQLFQLLTALAEGILRGDAVGDAGPGPSLVGVSEVSHEVPAPGSGKGQAEGRDMTPLLIKNQSPETLLAELERQPNVVNAGEVLAKLALHVDSALRTNKIERALKVMAGILRCEQAVPETNRRQYAIALKRMFTRGLLEGVAHLTQLAGHQADAVAVLRRAGASGVEVLLDQLVASPSLEERSGTFAALTHMKEGLEQVIQENPGAIVYRMEDRRPDAASS